MCKNSEVLTYDWIKTGGRSRTRAEKIVSNGVPTHPMHDHSYEYPLPLFKETQCRT